MKRFAFFWAAVCSAATLFADFTGHKIELDRPDGYYQVGDTAVKRGKEHAGNRDERAFGFRSRRSE